MNNYDLIKDVSFSCHHHLVNFMSLDEIINLMEQSIEQQLCFEEIVYNLLKHFNLDDETLSSLFSLSTTDALKEYIKTIKNG